MSHVYVSSSILSVSVQEIDTRNFLPTLLNPRTTSPTPKTLQQNRKPPVFFHPKFPSTRFCHQVAASISRSNVPWDQNESHPLLGFWKTLAVEFKERGFPTPQLQEVDKKESTWWFQPTHLQKNHAIRVKFWGSSSFPQGVRVEHKQNNLSCHHPGFYTTFGDFTSHPSMPFWTGESWKILGKDLGGSGLVNPK